MNLTCELYCDGEVEGAIRSTHEVSIGEKGSFKGDVFADKITVLGRIEGSVDARRIEIRSGGCIKGIITSSELVIEPKGIFEGESRIKRESDADE